MGKEIETVIGLLHTVYELSNGAKLYLGGKKDAQEAKQHGLSAIYIDVVGKIGFLDHFYHTMETNLGAVSVFVSWIDYELSKGNDVVVYCQAGIERSPLVCACYLYECGPEDCVNDFNKAYSMVIESKKDVLPREYLLPRWYTGE